MNITNVKTKDSEPCFKVEYKGKSSYYKFCSYPQIGYESYIANDIERRYKSKTYPYDN